MLALANTSEGKDLLCIEDHGLPIIGIKKNAVLYDQGDQLMADFRVGAKWGNVVRYRWQEIKRALDRMNELSLLKARQAGIPAGAASITKYPDPHPENDTCDGTTFTNKYPPVNWSTIRSGAATSGYAHDDNLYWGMRCLSGFGTINCWSYMRRSFFFFDTSDIGAGSTISAATLSLYVASVDAAWGGGGTDFTWGIYAKSGTSDQTDITSGDGLSLGTTLQAPSLSRGSTSSSAYSAFVLNSTGRDHISETAITKFGMRSANYDAANTEPTNPGAGTYATGATIRASEDTGGDKDPKLVVTYTVPTTAAVTGEIGNGATEQAVRSAT